MVTLALMLLAAAEAAAQSSPAATLVKAARLIDPRTGNALAPAAVLVEDGRIKEVGAPNQVQGDAPATARVVDLGSATLLPGLIDGHRHLLLDVIVPQEAQVKRTFTGEFEPGLLLAVARHDAECARAPRLAVGTRSLVEWLYDRAQTSGTRVSTVTPRSEMRSMQAACRDLASWPRDASSSRQGVLPEPQSCRRGRDRGTGVPAD